MDIHTTHTTHNAEDTQALGGKVADYIKAQGVGESTARQTICLYGDLGSGKTTFVQGFARALGIQNRLLSPTFIIVRRYEIPKQIGFLYHMDLYRTSSSKDIQDIGFGDFLHETDSIVIVEWADKLGSLKPKPTLDIYFSLQKDDTHSIRIL